MSANLLSLISPMDAPPVAGVSLILQPAAVYVSSTSTLTVTISVPLKADPVTINSNQGIAVTFPVQGNSQQPLVTTLAGITYSPPPLWSVRGPQGGKFIIYPINGLTLNAGDSIQVQFQNLTIVANTGSASVAFDVNSSAGKGNTTLPVNIQAVVPGVIVWADPGVVGLNAPATLRWVAQGASQVRISGFTTGSSGYKDFPVTQGQAASTDVDPTEDGNGAAQHTYQLQAMAGTQAVGPVQPITVYLHEPYISQFGLVKPGSDSSAKVQPSLTINYGDQVTARWRTIFTDDGQGVLLTYGAKQLRDAPVSEQTIDPSVALAPNGSTVNINLTAPGWKQNAGATAQVNYTPITIRYFKFNQWTTDDKGDHFSDIVWQLDPPGAANLGALNNAPIQPTPPTPQPAQQLSAQGPGGPLIQYLGTGNEPYLEIRYFSPAGTVKASQPFTLQWFTNNASILTLQTPDGTTSITTSQIAKGTSAPQTISQTTEYILTATGSNGNSVKSYLIVTPT